MEPLVTVVMPAYNAEATIAESISSLQAQTFRDWMLLVVDDGSRDETPKIVNGFAANDPRIQLFVQVQNAGPAAARNRGIRNAKGRYIAFLDSDDMWRPEKLAVQVDAMQASDAVMSYHDYRQMSEDGKLMGDLIKGPDYLDWATLHKRRGVGCLTVMIDRIIAPEFAFPEQHRDVLAEDFLAWANLLRPAGRHAIRVPADLAFYRLLNSSRSSKRVRAVKSVWTIYRKFEAIPVLTAAWFFCCYLIDALRLRAVGRPRHERS